ncbi:arylsulfatase [Algoriphagus formosus]|uniref:arylsulfatase n=1 Tax=Algoriphagus formosus TaxID=2007308 RepID=UPI003F6EC3ED
MKLGQLLWLLFFTLILASCKSDEVDQSEGRPNPNIILIMTDDQGWGDLGINGNPDLSTPNIDRLTREGARFERFFVSPVCSPTRAELLTGRYAVRGGVYSTSAGGERLDLDETTIAEVFKEAGYRTAAYGKWHNGMQPPYHPNARGFDDFYGFCSGHWGDYFSPMLERNNEIVEGEGFLVDDLTEKGLSFIETNKDQPFFLYLPYNTPHSPMQVPDEWWSKFENKKLDSLYQNPEMQDMAFTRAAYAMCENIDWNVGRLMTKLEELGMLENTIVLYLSDNGPNGWRWNGGMRGRKGSTDEGGVRSPLAIQWKGQIEAGTIIPQIAFTPDLLPTLADLAGIPLETDKALDGKSLKPLLLKEEREWPERLLVSHWGNQTSVRSQDFRLDHEDRLYHIPSDPGQQVDVSEDYVAIKEKLLTKKKEWIASVLVELPENDTRNFTIGHPDFANTQIPARDGQAHGTIQRSNRWPNDSFFTNWTSTEDKITWEVEVLEAGKYEVEIYYTCAEENMAPMMRLSLGNASLSGPVDLPHNPPLEGMEYDRVPRGESYVKDFRPFTLGTIDLEKGVGTLSLEATQIPGNQAIDFRLMTLRRLEE